MQDLEIDLNLIDDNEYDLVENKAKISSDQILEQPLQKEFAVGEHMAHTLAYESHKLPFVITENEEDDLISVNKENPVIAVNEEDGKSRNYKVHTITTGTEKIVASAYVPHNITESNAPTARIYVNFMGTKTLATAIADTEFCPGEKSFHKYKTQFMKEINNLIGDVKAQTDKPIELIISGHSLGGAYAQQFLNESLRYKALSSLKSQKAVNQFLKEEEKLNGYISEQYNITNQDVPKANRENFSNVHLKLNAWNSAGVSKPVENYSNAVADLLLTNAPTTKITARYGMVGGDLVQTTGEGSVLSKSTKADVAIKKIDIGVEGYKTAIAKSVVGSAIGGLAAGAVLGPIGSATGALLGLGLGGLSTLKAHCSKHFAGQTEIPHDLKYEISRNDTAEGQAKVTKRLQNKSTVLPKLTYGYNRLLSMGKGFFGQFSGAAEQPRPRV